MSELLTQFNAKLSLHQYMSKYFLNINQWKMCWRTSEPFLYKLTTQCQRKRTGQYFLISKHTLSIAFTTVFTVGIAFIEPGQVSAKSMVGIQLTLSPPETAFQTKLYMKTFNYRTPMPCFPTSEVKKIKPELSINILLTGVLQTYSRKFFLKKNKDSLLLFSCLQNKIKMTLPIMVFQSSYHFFVCNIWLPIHAEPVSIIFNWIQLRQISTYFISVLRVSSMLATLLSGPSKIEKLKV